MTTTERVREAIPEILKREEQPVSTKQLSALIAKEVTGYVEDGKERTGILRGIVHKHQTNQIPIPHVTLWKLNDVLYFEYVEDKVDLLTKEIQQFLKTVEEKQLLSENMMLLSKDKLNRYQQLVQEIITLSELVNA